MKEGNSETRKINSAINELINQVNYLINNLSSGWDKVSFPENIPELMKRISFFQRRYVPKEMKVNTDLIVKNFEIYEKSIETFVQEEGQFKRFIKDIFTPEEDRKPEDLKPELRKAFYRTKYGRFKENPTEDLNKLLDGLIKIDRYFRKNHLKQEMTQDDYREWTNPITQITRQIPKQNIKWFKRGFFTGLVFVLLGVVLPLVLNIVLK